MMTFLAEMWHKAHKKKKFHKKIPLLVFAQVTDWKKIRLSLV
jgi:hypothetical protein